MKRQFTAFVLLGFTLLFGAQDITAQTYARNGMVVSANKLASQVGTDVLKKGGNVIDATVATVGY
jgi:gamma-glutamyltranspeptidase/glutathione hydrolase